MKHLKLVASAVAFSALVSTNTFATYHHKYQHENYSNVKCEVPCSVQAPSCQPLWTGFYVGIDAGLSEHTMSVTDLDYDVNGGTLDQTSRNDFSPGLHIGYREQLNQQPISGVFGIEAAINWVNSSYNESYDGIPPNYQISSKLRNYETLQLIGGLAANRTLLFLSAGFAYGDFEGAWIHVRGNSDESFNNLGDNVFGLVAGAGVEYAFTDTIFLRAKVETASFNRYSSSDADGSTNAINNYVTNGSIGLNWKFA